MAAVGWLSSLVLLLTITYQVRAQWRAADNGGVSIWLYVGQLTASAGFLVYSLWLGDWVFVATNALMVLTAITGSAIHIHNARV